MYDQSSYTPEIARAEADFADAESLVIKELRQEFDGELANFLADCLDNARFRSSIRFAAGIDRDTVVSEKEAEAALLEWLKGRTKQ